MQTVAEIFGVVLQRGKTEPLTFSFLFSDPPIRRTALLCEPQTDAVFPSPFAQHFGGDVESVRRTPPLNEKALHTAIITHLYRRGAFRAAAKFSEVLRFT